MLLEDAVFSGNKMKHYPKDLCCTFYFMYTVYSFESKFTELNMFLKIYGNAVSQEYFAWSSLNMAVNVAAFTS